MAEELAYEREELELRKVTARLRPDRWGRVLIGLRAWTLALR